MINYIFILLLVLLFINRYRESYTNYEAIKIFIKTPIFQALVNKNVSANLDKDNCLNEDGLRKSIIDTINSVPIPANTKSQFINEISKDKNLYEKLLIVKRKHSNLFPNKICKSDINTIISLFIKKYLNIN